jgi:hypothetical protein
MKHARSKRNGRKRHVLLLPVFWVAVVVLVLGGAVPNSWADDVGDENPFSVANIYFELNNTDGDLGIHALIDGDPWKWIKIEGPNERTLLWVSTWSKLRRQGLTELFFESAEPPLDELSPRRFFRRFPVGTYEIEGRTLDGDELESEVEVTHVMPAPASNITVNEVDARPVAGEECDEEILPTASGDVTIEWDPVTASHPSIGETDPDIEIVRYEPVAEWEDEDENVYVFSVVLPPDQTSITVPAAFFEGAEEFKVEVLAREASGNQTAVESCPFEYTDGDE